MSPRSLSHYTISSPLGSGGMGEVYRATDTKLQREVAIKILPEASLADRELRARFEREARTLASLHHPHVATLFGFEEDQGTSFLVMELVDGQELSERMADGPIDAKECIRLARQFAEGLEAAHEKQIVHRDLKPANIKLTPDGELKILDFGLARGYAEGDAEGASAEDLANSPTITGAMTMPGVILGTAGYMSPEQAKGRPVDKRSDIWAFGLILFEMLSGRRMFEAETVSETLAAVLMAEIDFARLPATTPPALRQLLERCLQRDPRQRLRDIGDARIALQEIAENPDAATATAAPARSRRLGPAILLTGLVALAIGLGIGRVGRGGDQAALVADLGIPIPATLRIEGEPRISPDRRTIAFRAIDVGAEAEDHRSHLYVRDLESNSLREVEDSRGVIAWDISPDGTWLAYATPTSATSVRYQLRKVPLDGSTPPIKIGDWPQQAQGLAWTGEDRLITLRRAERRLIQISVSSGVVSDGPEIASETSPSDYFRAAPGDDHLFLTNSTFEGGDYRQDLLLVDLQSGAARQLVADAGRSVAFSPSGHLLFSRRDQLLAVPFDPNTLTTSGTPRPVLDGLWAEGLYTGGYFDISPQGDLVFGAGDVQRQERTLEFVDFEGQRSLWSDEALLFEELWVSPDGRRVAAHIDNITSGDALLQIRVAEIDRARFVTVGAAPRLDCGRAMWSPSSEQLCYMCWDTQQYHVFLSDGRRAAESPIWTAPYERAVSLVGFSFGDEAVFFTQLDDDGRAQLMSLPLEGTGEAQTIAMDDESWVSGSMLTSPDGRWLVYRASAAGRSELMLRELLAPDRVGPRIPLGLAARWAMFFPSDDADILRLVAGNDDAHSLLQVRVRPSVQVGDAERLPLDTTAQGILWYWPMPDGRLLAVVAPDTEFGASELRFVLNFGEMLKSE